MSYKHTNIKKYVAVLSQSGTAAPVATVLENTLGGNVVWTRTGTGTYNANLQDGFPINKTLIPVPIYDSLDTTVVLYRYVDSSNISVETDDSGSVADGILGFKTAQYYAEFIVYP